MKFAEFIAYTEVKISVRVLKEDGQIVRRIHCDSGAVAAYVCGDEVFVQMVN